ncbi:MAG: transcription termination factor Rho [Pseudomonadota bacterium]
MAKKERKDKKEKPLDKMTSKELKEVAFTIPEISGVHGMNKAELIAAVKQARGIAEEKKVKAGDIREIKQKIALLKKEKHEAIEAGNKGKMEILRRKISRLKKKTRRAA